MCRWCEKKCCKNTGDVSKQQMRAGMNRRSIGRVWIQLSRIRTASKIKFKFKK